MGGGIQPGSTASSPESISSEEKHIDHVAAVISEMGDEWESRKSVTIEELLGHPGEYSRRKDGTSQEWESDGGFIFHRGQLVGACENKYQKTRENACERVCKYLTFLLAPQLFISCVGPGFVKKDGGGSTGPLIDMLRHKGATVLENVDEKEFTRELKLWLKNLVNA